MRPKPIPSDVLYWYAYSVLLILVGRLVPDLLILRLHLVLLTVLQSNRSALEHLRAVQYIKGVK
jgi:hypothetical protein